MDHENEQDQPLEVLPPSALEAMERAQVDVQIATAHRFPRSVEQFKKRALTMATLDIETAESCIYSRPVGKDPKTGKQKFAEGASIRLAEIVGASYGNLRAAARIVEQTDRYVKCEGVAHDLESNFAVKSEVMESTVDSNGRPFSERMRVVVAKACLSKALRDATFRVVPKAMCKSIYDAAKKTASGQGKTIAQRQAAVKSWLDSINVDEARVFAALGVNGWSEIGEEQLITLTGLKTSISDQDVTIEEAFPPVTKRPDFGQQPPSGNATGTTGTAVAPGTATPRKAQTAPVQQQDTTTNKPARVAEFAPGGVQTADTTGKAPPRPGKPAPQRIKETPVKEPEGQTEPEQPPTVEQPGEPEEDRAPSPEEIAGTAGEPEPGPTGPAEFHPNPHEGEHLTNLRQIMFRDGIMEDQLVAFCHATPGLLDAKKGQNHLSDMSEQKCKNLVTAWPNVLPKIKK